MKRNKEKEKLRTTDVDQKDIVIGSGEVTQEYSAMWCGERTRGTVRYTVWNNEKRMAVESVDRQEM